MSTVCPFATCSDPDLCSERRHCALTSSPLILAPMSDWRADPTPYPLRNDTKPRAVWPQGVAP